jgi:hypothetical protein
MKTCIIIKSQILFTSVLNQPTAFFFFIHVNRVTMANTSENPVKSAAYMIQSCFTY